MIGNPQVIEYLQLAIAGESLAEHQYICDSEWLDRIGLNGLAPFIAARANEEKEHFTDFARRLIFYGSDPIASPKPTQGHANVTEMLNHELQQEQDAVALYTNACRLCFSVYDYVTFDMFREILADEQEHVRYIEGALYLIGQMGEANYLQAYVQPPKEG